MAPAITLQAKRNQIRVITKLPNKKDFYWQRKEYTCKTYSLYLFQNCDFPIFINQIKIKIHQNLVTKQKLKTKKIL